MKPQIILLCFFLFGMSTVSIAQKTLTELVELSEPDKKGRYDKKWTSRFGYVHSEGDLTRQMKKLGLKVDKVGLLTFLVSDGKQVTVNNGATLITTTTVQMSEASLDNASNFMYALSIDEIQNNLKEPGIQLLLPKDYLSTEALKTPYQELTLNESGGSKLLKGIGKVATFGGAKYEKDKVGAPEGYREFINLSTAAKSIMFC